LTAITAQLKAPKTMKACVDQAAWCATS
jgi:hypothetical protein